MSAPASTDPRWYGLYRAAAGAALVIAVLLVGEIVVYAAFPRPTSAVAHFELFERDPLAGLLTLDLLGLVSYVLFVPVTLAVYVAVRRTSEAAAAIAVVLFVIGVADFFATNTAFPVLALSHEYATATTDAERAAILAAGQAMFTLFNENAFLVSYVIVSVSWAMLGATMLRSPLFARAAGWSGVLAGVAGALAVVLEHASGALVGPAIALYFAAIVFLLAWVVLIARGLGALRSTQ